MVPRADHTFSLEAEGVAERAVDIPGSSKEDSTPAILYKYHNGKNQRVSITMTGAGEMTFQFVHSGKVLDVTGSSKIAGTAIIQYSPHGGANQQWIVSAC